METCLGMAEAVITKLIIATCYISVFCYWRILKKSAKETVITATIGERLAYNVPTLLAIIINIPLFFFYMLYSHTIESNQIFQFYDCFPHLALMAGFDTELMMGLMGLCISPGAWIDLAGAALIMAGAVFAVWGRHYLGDNWSHNVARQERHELIRSGPYVLVRHPIYTGFILGSAGTALVIDRWAALIGLSLEVAGLLIKAMLEERMMRKAFGQAYADYCRVTPRLIPSPPGLIRFCKAGPDR